MSKSKIPTIKEFMGIDFFDSNIQYSETHVIIKLKEYAELVRAATLEEVVEKGDDYTLLIDKQSILDLVNHKNLEIK